MILHTWSFTNHKTWWYANRGWLIDIITLFLSHSRWLCLNSEMQRSLIGWFFILFKWRNQRILLDVREILINPPTWNKRHLLILLIFSFEFWNLIRVWVWVLRDCTNINRIWKWYWAFVLPKYSLRLSRVLLLLASLFLLSYPWGYLFRRKLDLLVNRLCTN